MELNVLRPAVESMSTRPIQVLVIVPVATENLSRIADADPRIRVVDARGWFDVEIAQTWFRWSVERYLAQRAVTERPRQERDRVLANAEIILGGWPFPLDLRTRSPRLRWFHQLPAGASNLLRGDLWKSDVIVTTSRGYGNNRANGRFAAISRATPSWRCYLRGLTPIDTSLQIVGGGQLTDELQRVIALLSVRISMRFEKDLAVLEVR
jgi:hypothetical protein